MDWPVRLACTRCGAQDNRHSVPIPVVTEARIAYTVTTSCACGQEFVWTVVCEGGFVRNVVEQE